MTTITKLKAVEDAFEAVLRWIDDYAETTGFETVEAMADAALPGLRSVIAEMLSAEPVAFVQAVWNDPSKATVCVANGKTISIGDLLYTNPQPKAEQCQHSIADARNPIVKNGYICVKCGALFSAADHAQPKAEPVQEPVYLVEDDFGLFRITDKADYTYWSSTGRHKTFIANAQPKAEPDAVAWAISRWIAEVANRPLKNVHRRSLDDTWRQVIRYFGVDDTKVLPLKTHDELVAIDIQNSRANDAIAQLKAEP